jgi:hypothetical protein
MTARPRRKSNATGRNTGVRFLKLEHWVLNSPAAMALSPAAFKLLIYVWYRYNGTNNGSIGFSVREAEPIGLSKDQAGRAFTELILAGFLKVGRESCFSLKTKTSRTWEITAERLGDKPPTKDFMRQHPPSVAPPPKIKTRSHQRDGQSHQRDTSPVNETLLPATVAPVRPAEPEMAVPRSHQRDTYNIPHGGGCSGRGTGTAGGDGSRVPGPADCRPDLPVATSPTHLAPSAIQ